MACPTIDIAALSVPDKRARTRCLKSGLPQLAETLQHNLVIQCNLCCHLERLADSLPGSSHRAEFLAIAGRLGPILRHVHEFEERRFFPAIEHAFRDKKLAATLERLRCEHCEDESFAGELSEAIFLYASDSGGIQADLLAYMLRGFFEGLRRHIAFEREHILPMVLEIDT